MGKTWTPNSWHSYKTKQQPEWYDLEIYNKVIQEIAKYPPLVFAGEVRELKHQLAEAAKGKGFLIQGGDCAETFIETGKFPTGNSIEKIYYGYDDDWHNTFQLQVKEIKKFLGSKKGFEYSISKIYFT